MGKRNLNRLFTGLILAGVLGISCPEMEQLAIVTALAETNEQEETTPSDKTTVTTASLRYSVTWKKKSGKRYCYRNGSRLTGFQQIDGSWYYFNFKGVMCTGWQNIRSHYRYFFLQKQVNSTKKQVISNNCIAYLLFNPV